MLRVRQIKIKVDNNSNDKLLNKISNKLHIKPYEITKYKIIKRSIDARDKENIFYVYEIDVEVKNEEEVLKKNKSNDVIVSNEINFTYEVTGTKKINYRPVVVGTGPCGLFVSYFLSEAGFNPIIIERGERVEDRIKSVEHFFETNELNINSNIQFGEGGAGTFSDGKLNTLVKDKLGLGKKVFEIFVECGAPTEILYDSHPHVGTDILRKVIINMRNKIIEMGGEFRYNTCLTNINYSNNKLESIEVNNKEIINTDIVVLAIGHSSRDTFYMLKDKNISMRPKPFAVGVRVEHKRDLIDTNQYGKYKDILGSASYKLTHKCKNGRGVYSFCMCPGGFVVNASSENECLVVNGMSNHNRSEVNSNSAIVVTVTPDDFGQSITSGIEFQRKLEKSAYIEGKGQIPVQKYIDFKNNETTKKLGSIIPNTKGKYTLSNLNNVLPEFIVESLIEGIDSFDNKIKGYASDDVLLLGVESRTSSPVIIERNEFGESIEGLFPAGEGAGYAGGITTASIDGIKTFLNIIKKYKIGE